MKYFQSFLLLLVCGTTFAQLDGSWQGVLIQDNQNGTTTNFAIWVELIVDGPQLKGSFRSEQANSPYYKISSIIGKINGDNVVIKDYDSWSSIKAINGEITKVIPSKAIPGT